MKNPLSSYRAVCRPGTAAAALFTALWGGRLIGRLVDRWGYRNVMIWDTVVLFFVCLLYGFAKDWSKPVLERTTER